MYAKDGSNSHKKIVLELNGATSDLQVIKKIVCSHYLAYQEKPVFVLQRILSPRSFMLRETFIL